MKKDATLSMCFNTREEVALASVWAAHFLHPLSGNFNRYIKVEKVRENIKRYMGDYGYILNYDAIHTTLHRFAQQCEYLTAFNPADRRCTEPYERGAYGRIMDSQDNHYVYLQTDPVVFSRMMNQINSKQTKQSGEFPRNADSDIIFYWRAEVALLQVFAAQFLHPLSGNLDRRISMREVMAQLRDFCGRYLSLDIELNVLQALYDYAHQCEYVADFNPLEMCRHMPTTRRAFGIIEDKEGEWYLYVKTDLVVFPLVAEQLATKKWRY